MPFLSFALLIASSEQHAALQQWRRMRENGNYSPTRDRALQVVVFCTENGQISFQLELLSATGSPFCIGAAFRRRRRMTSICCSLLFWEFGIKIELQVWHVIMIPTEGWTKIVSKRSNFLHFMCLGLGAIEMLPRLWPVGAPSAENGTFSLRLGSWNWNCRKSATQTFATIAGIGQFGTNKKNLIWSLTTTSGLQLQRIK